ncbi:hypothetical protein M2347_002758 [Chryseobacterium sp. H1D6B]|uniref:hypothetical protein n=1 Tax=Chryseobacterium sp. H1D6B TaxID=2940588 RepID=UPI00179B2098|nr:hypothetical protein [Chryseobacterium sp. H1D6B]MDH6253031.1 hypothetical protein [Chryseobacterium sp. H1D6B]
MKHIVHFLFLPCSKATFLIEKKNAGSLSRKEKFQLSVHLQICTWCKAYNKKAEILHELLRKIFIEKKNVEINNIDIKEFKDKVIKKLDF